MKKIIAALIITTSLVSCTKNFKELNSSKDGAKYTTPETLLGPAVHDVLKKNLNRCLRLTHELMQVHVTLSDGDEIHRYVIRPQESDYMWNNWYLQLTNIKDIYKGGDVINSKAFMGISLVLDAWVSSLLTDVYGDVPYFDANKGRDHVLQPRFDKQKDIYQDLFKKLEEANELFKTAGDKEVEDKMDPIFAGDITKWRKFGNSLYLRLLLRVSGTGELGAVDKILDIVETKKTNYPIFTSNNDSAILKFQTMAPYLSEFAEYRPIDFQVNNSLSEFFINNLNDWGDPRRDKWVTKKDNAFIGIPSGYPVGQVPAPQSQYVEALKKEPLLGNIINYPELQFILAECAVKGYIPGDAKTYYEAGVTAALGMWGYTVPSGYLTTTSAQWYENDNASQKLHQIILQKYYTLFFTDFQTWIEHRRTGFPILPKGFGLQNDGIMPTRLKYPVNVQRVNQQNYLAAVASMGGDDLKTKVWWNK
ncbi:SusD/RagB family nutrient-binding outer membrane lipoprotein [uncultured Pedobacter sp.]|uniref:SusD/RagB family nutrient-binding outer membrane lipoprotein n=1 Tax=uncultured Pedobacter sp. TaxID=246139 RepID=UPI00262F7CE8|nr:SusD/RagB family nutrient-binding outer membrane lipoprotein [uncultured Pedobacter sp.]